MQLYGFMFVLGLFTGAFLGLAWYVAQIVKTAKDAGMNGAVTLCIMLEVLIFFMVGLCLYIGYVEWGVRT